MNPNRLPQQQLPQTPSAPPPIPPRLTKSTSSDVSVFRPKPELPSPCFQPLSSFDNQDSANSDNQASSFPPAHQWKSTTSIAEGDSEGSTADLEGIDFWLAARESRLRESKAKGLSSSEDNISHYNYDKDPKVYPDIRAAFLEVLPRTPGHNIVTDHFNHGSVYSQPHSAQNQQYPAQNWQYPGQTQQYPSQALPQGPPPPPGFVLPENGVNGGYSRAQSWNDYYLTGSVSQASTFATRATASPFNPSSAQGGSTYNKLNMPSLMGYPMQSHLGNSSSMGGFSTSTGYTFPHPDSWSDLAAGGQGENVFSQAIPSSSQSLGGTPTDSYNLIHLGWNIEEEPEYMTLEAFDPLYQKIPEHPDQDKGASYLDGIYSLTTYPNASGEITPEKASHVNLPPAPGNYEDILDVLAAHSSASSSTEKGEDRGEAEVTEKQDNVYEALSGVSRRVSSKCPPRPPRPFSKRLSKQALRDGDYEMLRSMTFIDEESRSFCEMVSKVKEKFLSTDECSNMGFVISSVQGEVPHEPMSVKVVIYADFANEAIPFTCDVDLLVEHVISQVLYTQFEETGSLTAADYILKVYDRSEYLLNMYPLSWYDYVQHCMKNDCDIKFYLCKRDQIALPLLRTIDDDGQPVFFPRDFIKKDPGEVSRESLDILMETFYREVERLRDQTLQGKAEVSQCRSLTQSVKAVCAILAKIETMALSKSLSRVQDIVSNLSHRTSQPAELDNDYIYSDPAETQDMDMGVRCTLLEDLQEALDELTKTVQQLVNLYCHTFHTDFILYDEDDGYTETQEVTGLIDNFLIQVASAHRIPVTWLNMYEEYYVECSLHHSGQMLGRSLFTKTMAVAKTGLCERILFDEWIQFEDIQLCALPRESRLCLTLYGTKTVPSANTSVPDDLTGKVKTALGGATVQLFDHKSHLVQGQQMMILRPGREADPLGPSLISLLPDSVLLQVNLPQLGKHIIYPEAVESEVKIQKPFSSLPTDDQEELKAVLHKDCITPLTADERELLWHRRHYLLENPAFLPKVLQSAHGWDWACLADIYILLRQWQTPSPTDALELLMPQFADHRVREFAVICLRNLDMDEMLNYLPQLVQALKFESYHVSPLAEMLLERACNSIRFAHKLFWLLKEAAQDSIYRQRYQLMFGAVMSVSGQALRKEFRKQEELMKLLGTTAEKVKMGRDKESTLRRELQLVYELFEQKKGILLPLNCSMEVTGIDLKSCSYFTSNAFPLKLVFKNQNFYAEPIYTMFKVGDDLRQDMLTLQLIRIMDHLWLKEGLDLKMITFSVLSTGPKRGMVELVTESETIRKIQASYGLTGSFKDRPLREWLQKHNITELDYQKAVDNFMRSCAGYCVATYVLGICDRHNDNIMLKQSGHMFHIDFGKFLGDSQMFGTFKRDRVPFVLTSDMAYVINGGERQSSRFQQFVDLCCQAFSILRKNANIFLSLFTLMSKSGIPGMSENAAAYVQTALLPGQSNAEATAFFTRMIDESLKSVFTQFNFFIHNLAQLKFSSHNEGALLSFVPKTYSINIDGKIKSVEVLACQKRYVPEKHYVYIIKVVREQHRVPSFIFRRFSEFVEFRDKLVAQFPLTAWHVLPTRLILGRSHVKTVAESRKAEIEKFLKELLLKAPEISGSDLVYTFFHPLLRDEQDISEQTEAPRTGEVTPTVSDGCEVKGQVKVALQYKKDALSVMIMHAKDLGCSLPVAPSPYVKTYLLPDPFKETKRKTKVVKNTNHPVYNEILLYKISKDEARNKILQVTIWDHDILKENEFMGAAFIKLRDIDLSQETIKWYPLGNLQVSISQMLA
ncbi:phosphatidylinositol 4-phosphate 3-kinase C2 domain-containing subunit alpha-like [Liolophura sinensis]|uniref:phosphatidylinositol 4-phosphate 3-kinase C2 domain-containing subunit alpha-like n=1 Tax=Liolophura sinensis TaxID=3198878 RepID=UPI00315919C3